MCKTPTPVQVYVRRLTKEIELTPEERAKAMALEVRRTTNALGFRRRALAAKAILYQ